MQNPMEDATAPPLVKSDRLLGKSYLPFAGQAFMYPYAIYLRVFGIGDRPQGRGRSRKCLLGIGLFAVIEVTVTERTIASRTSVRAVPLRRCARLRRAHRVTFILCLLRFLLLLRARCRALHPRDWAPLRR